MLIVGLLLIATGIAGITATLIADARRRSLALAGVGLGYLLAITGVGCVFAVVISSLN